MILPWVWQFASWDLGRPPEVDGRPLTACAAVGFMGPAKFAEFWANFGGEVFGVPYFRHHPKHHFAHRWWFQTFVFSPLFGEDEPILTNIFQSGLKPRTSQSWPSKHSNHRPSRYRRLGIRFGATHGEVSRIAMRFLAIFVDRNLWQDLPGRV